jgi:hypothetical protein
VWAFALCVQCVHVVTTLKKWGFNYLWHFRETKHCMVRVIHTAFEKTKFGEMLNNYLHIGNLDCPFIFSFSETGNNISANWWWQPITGNLGKFWCTFPCQNKFGFHCIKTWNSQPFFLILHDTVYSLLKGIVQRDLTGVETRLKKSVLLSYSVGKFFF